jgi:hypothetical protein
MNNLKVKPKSLGPTATPIIRYCMVEGSLWYSLLDVVEFLRYKKAIRVNRNIDFLFRKELAKKNAKGGEQYGFNQTLSISPFDDFINWVKFDSIYHLCLKSETQKIKEAHILEAIDMNHIEQIKMHYPSISECLKEVKLIANY